MGAGLVPKVSIDKTLIHLSYTANYTTDSLDLDILDEVVPVHSDEAVTMANELWMIGLPVGASSGGESLMNNVTAKKE
jgi:cysteine synthase